MSFQGRDLPGERISRRVRTVRAAMAGVTAARVATLAAVVATAGDLLLLWAANGGRPALRAVWLGGALGVLGIPLYALGYGAAGGLLARPASGRLVRAAGAGAALLGAIIHGLTARLVAADLDAAGPRRDPIAAVAASGLTLPLLWAVSAVLVAWASIVFARDVARGASALPRWAAWTTPALLTVGLALAGLPTAALRAFLTPAAPNLAHVGFFAVLAAQRRLSVGATQ
jgi:hypothetical protein